ncbi:MAG: penicillin-binding protein [Paludibacter sp.]
MADARKDIVLRFGIAYIFICLMFVFVIYNIVIIQFVERDNWLALAAHSRQTNIPVKANRGNIYACDGRLLASSIPTYYVFMDLRVPALHEKNGKLFKDNIDSLSIYLSSFFHDRTAYEYKMSLKKAYDEGKGEYQLYPERISYEQLKQLRTLPLLRLGRNKSGLIPKELFSRVNPFGSLASRTIGNIYADEAMGGKNGLEKGYDSLLIGTPGVSIRQKVANTYMETVQVEPIDGMDVTTTIDVDLQDIAEKALVDSLRSFDASSGYVILMEVQSGEVKAIVNMQQNTDKSYSENRNGAVSDLVEPGSTFKVASLMVALDAGKVKITDSIQTGNGIYYYGKSAMKDWNANHGGFHKISVADAINASSNIGISRVIVNAYGQNPSAFVDGLYNMKLNEHINFGIPGSATPRIPHPKDKSRYWSNATLPWLSIGYVAQIPPIYTLAFYNAIANNGKYITPILVKKISRNGQVVKTFEAETIKESICKPSTLRDIKITLLGVLEGRLATARNVHSKYVRIAGKTGTALISKGVSGYKTGGKTYQVSFCGYFPAEAPKYTCIVVIREPKIGYPSGGKMAGSVFKDVAEKTMALKSDRTPINMASDTIGKYPFTPYTKTGYSKALQLVMTDLDLPIVINSDEWVKPVTDKKQTRIEPLVVYNNVVPDLTGMGAKDAVFLAEKLGLNVQVEGRGKVVSQNLKPGVFARKGTTILLNFD